MNPIRTGVFAAVFLLTECAVAESCPETLDFSKKRLNTDEEVHLCTEYAGKVVLIVNTASKCTFTPQYEGLEKLYEEYQNRGLVVLGFPSDDFGGQEPGSEANIQDFCRLTYSVSFPMFEKTHAAYGKADTLYTKLAELAREYPGWNFHKYLLDRNGRLVASFKSWVKPEDDRLRNAVEKLL